jgi:tryptophan-rich sensory protein
MRNSYVWYQTLIKPDWAPPSWLFGPVWTFLYVIITITFGKVFLLAFQKQLPLVVALPFALNLLFNFLFTPIQFGLKNNLLASIDILLVLATLIWAMIAIHPHVKWVALANIPYLLWVMFATVLQLTITYLNLK